MTSTVTYAAPDGTIDAAFARPDGEGPWPAVLMLTDIWGLRDVYRDMAERLARQGYAVLVPNLYYRLGDDAPKGREDFAAPGVREKAMGWKASLTRDRIVADMRAAVSFLDAQPVVARRHLGVIGYCMSATFALWTAAAFRDRIAAAAGFHGAWLATAEPDSPHRLADLYDAELYFGHAENDPMLPPEQIAALDTALREANAHFVTEVYPAGHGYAIADGPSYDSLAADRHWNAVAALLNRTLPGVG